MKPQELIRKYQAGRLTPSGLILQLLHESREQTVTQTLQLLPPGLLRQFKGFVRDLRPDAKVFRGPTPNPKTVGLATDWFAERVVAQGCVD